MMRSVWKGTITFGLVSIPIAVCPATREEKVAFKRSANRTSGRRSGIATLKTKRRAGAFGDN